MTKIKSRDLDAIVGICIPLLASFSDHFPFLPSMKDRRAHKSQVVSSAIFVNSAWVTSANAPRFSLWYPSHPWGCSLQPLSTMHHNHNSCASYWQSAYCLFHLAELRLISWMVPFRIDPVNRRHECRPSRSQVPFHKLIKSCAVFHANKPDVPAHLEHKFSIRFIAFLGRFIIEIQGRAGMK